MSSSSVICKIGEFGSASDLRVCSEGSGSSPEDLVADCVAPMGFLVSSWAQPGTPSRGVRLPRLVISLVTRRFKLFGNLSASRVFRLGSGEIGEAVFTAAKASNSSLSLSATVAPRGNPSPLLPKPPKLLRVVFGLLATSDPGLEPPPTPFPPLPLEAVSMSPLSLLIAVARFKTLGAMLARVAPAPASELAFSSLGLAAALGGLLSRAKDLVLARAMVLPSPLLGLSARETREALVPRFISL
mmetsp:Transcript_56969/g.121049  ORF Transcript_56969/g.121049 Transcript_56969/m.121049 type:complete len:243 (+) Transcript_56969:1439-2167(+)